MEEVGVGYQEVGNGEVLGRDSLQLLFIYVGEDAQFFLRVLQIVLL
eukprot:CAMPEP_0170563314 /NCGR_PEP_ID=MMETSP0211-20121228/65779_1 /TAXON_ID=311385 /ORGANISM="Pseudokeronopsis sp., Strain OXSARD2" /LENGTH=45 /DNA_ID= /DNA_START= /DNA_END= /DNA_ORIENTATION=